MALQYETIQVESRFGVTAHSLFITQQGGSDKLLVMLPGRGYTNDQPVLYYLRMAALELGYDVLSVEYGFQAANIDLTPENTPFIQDDVNQATKQVLSRGYSHVCIAGKSLGTPLAAGLAENLTNTSVSLILLTPIGGVTLGLGSIPTLAIIGTADKQYVPEHVKDEPHLTWRVFDDLDHSLEKRGDWRASLAVLQTIITDCETFLRKHFPK
jgi:acetyl esterase/lipase